MFNHGLEWDKWALNEPIHSRQRFNRHLFHARRRSNGVAYTVVPLVTLECTSRVINPLYHCRHSAKDTQYDSERGIVSLAIRAAQSSGAKLRCCWSDSSRSLTIDWRTQRTPTNNLQHRHITVQPAILSTNKNYNKNVCSPRENNFIDDNDNKTRLVLWRGSWGNINIWPVKPLTSKPPAGKTGGKAGQRTFTWKWPQSDILHCILDLVM